MMSHWTWLVLPNLIPVEGVAFRFTKFKVVSCIQLFPIPILPKPSCLIVKRNHYPALVASRLCHIFVIRSFFYLWTCGLRNVLLLFRSNMGNDQKPIWVVHKGPCPNSSKKWNNHTISRSLFLSSKKMNWFFPFFLILQMNLMGQKVQFEGGREWLLTLQNLGMKATATMVHSHPNRHDIWNIMGKIIDIQHQLRFRWIGIENNQIRSD